MELKELLTFDPLDTVERVTGKRLEDDHEIFALGIGVMQEWHKKKEKALKERGDTTFNNKLSVYISIIEAYGFEKVLELDFIPKPWSENDPPRHEKFFIYATRDGMLLKFDTYNSTEVNGGSVYYNWKPYDVSSRWGYTSSGQFVDHNGAWVWAGDHDCREALIFNLDNLRNNGTIVSPWVKIPFLYLLHHGDTKIEGYDYHLINNERLAMLPDWVQKFITGV